MVTSVASSRSAALKPPSLRTVTIIVRWKTVRSSAASEDAGLSAAARFVCKSFAVELIFEFAKTLMYAASARSGKAIPLAGDEAGGVLMLTAYALAVGITEVQLTGFDSRV